MSAASSPSSTRSSLVAKTAFLIGSAGLLIATTTNTLAVLGRHTGLTLLGSIEVVQAATVLLATAAMVLATRSDSHASIRFLTSRVAPPVAHRLRQLTALISLLFCLILLSGCLLVVVAIWNHHERSDLLHIPLRWLRLLLVVSVVLMAGYLISHLRKPGDRS